MSIPFRIEHGTAHRFLREAEVTMTADGAPAPEAASSKPGQRIFEIPDTAKEVLLLLVVRGKKPQRSIVLRLQQVFRLTAAKPLSVTATEWGPTRVGGTNGRKRTGFDPRINQFNVVTSPHGAAVRIAVDIPFLDVSEFVLDQSFGGTTIRSFYGSHTPGANLFVLEYTKGRPRAWLVLVPPAIDATTSKVGALVFYRPTGDAYDYPEGRPLFDYFRHRIARYLVDPDRASPFYIVSGSFIPIGSFGFANQLAQSHKPAILVYPVPHGGSFFDAKDQKGLDLVADIVRCLWADGSIASARDVGVELGTLGISGFSHGGEALMSTLASNVAAVHARPATKAVEELYAFDPNTFTANTGVVQKWFASGGKRLRMLAGAFENATMFGLAKTLGSADATVQPGSDAYWRDDPLYRAAMQEPGSPASFTDATEPAAPHGSLSRRTGIFFVKHDATGVTLEARWLDSHGKPKSAKRLVGGYSHAEAVAVIQFQSMASNPTQYPVKDAAAFDHVIQELQKRDENNETAIVRARHEWPGMGGEDSASATDRGATFKGFLQLALERSRF